MGRYNQNLTLIRVCVPMFTFEFDDELFRFVYDTPTFAPLFQLPPKWASSHPKSL